MKRLHRNVARSALLLVAGAAGTQGLASCADSEPTPQAVFDAGPEPDTSTPIPPPDAGILEPCTGSTWCGVALPPSPVSLNGIWGSGPNDVWIVGSPDLTLHWDGARLLSATVATRQTLFGVWGSKKDDVWTFSAGNAMWHSAGFVDAGEGGAGWSMFDGGGDGGGRGWPGPISAMWGRNANDIWAVGPFSPEIGMPTIWHCDGWRDGNPEWFFAQTSVPTPSDPAPHPEALSFNAIWGNPNSEVWIVGMSGKTRYGKGLGGKGASWSAVNSGTSTDLHAVWGSADGDVWAAGAGGTMRRFSRATGGTYVASQVPLPTTATIYGLTGFAANDIWAVGSGGVVLHYDGTIWTLVDVSIADKSKNDLYAVWGSGPDDVWVAGKSTLLHRGSAPLPRKSP